MSKLLKRFKRDRPDRASNHPSLSAARLMRHTLRRRTKIVPSRLHKPQHLRPLSWQRKLVCLSSRIGTVMMIKMSTWSLFIGCREKRMRPGHMRTALCDKLLQQLFPQCYRMRLIQWDGFVPYLLRWRRLGPCWMSIRSSPFCRDAHCFSETPRIYPVSRRHRARPSQTLYVRTRGVGLSNRTADTSQCSYWASRSGGVDRMFTTNFVGPPCHKYSIRGHRI